MSEAANPAPKPPPDGNLRGLRGPKATVISKIKELPIPDHRKAYLEAEINLTDGDGVVIDGHFADQPEHRNQHLTVKKLY